MNARAAGIGAALRRGRPIAVVLGAVVLLLVAVLLTIDVRADMTDLLPAGHTESERFLMGELRSGPATGVVLLGIEGADPAALARISRSMAQTLSRSDRFTLVSNGAMPDSADQDFLFRNRYLLSSATRSDAFTEQACAPTWSGC